MLNRHLLAGAGLILASKAAVPKDPPHPMGQEQRRGRAWGNCCAQQQQEGGKRLGPHLCSFPLHPPSISPFEC